MAYLLALLSAALFGAADFAGGLTARRASTIGVVVVSQFAGLVLVAVLLPVLPPVVLTQSDMTWGAAAGVAGGIGVALLYRALAIGTMAVAAPTTAVCAVVIPVMAAMVTGERPGAGTYAGIVLALAAIVLVSQAPGADGGGVPAAAATRGIGTALLAGVAIGFFFLLLARSSPQAGLWPLLFARAASVAGFAVAAVAGGVSLRMGRNVTALVVAAGLMDMAANVLYLLASRRGALSVVVTLSSLYPASTVLLARVVLGERLTRLQVAGVAAALVAILLIVRG